MLAIIFLMLSIFLGYLFIKIFTPYLLKPRNLYMHFAQSTKLIPKFLIVFPASFSIGVVISGWLLYIPSYIARENESPLLYGCVISFAFMSIIALLNLIIKRSAIHNIRHLLIKSLESINQNKALALFFSLVLVFAIWLMTLTFYVEDGYLRIGSTVYSDFSVHTAIIRSFSIGSNFPTQFPHYPDGTIRYHFMFQFYVGALEYMGLRMDLALNIMSIIALFNVTMLLYVTAVIITNKRAVGILSVIFFLFRSSFTGIRFLADHWPFDNIWQFINLITGNTGFIGRIGASEHFYTSHHEAWGIWNMNVYANQRHFALGISLMLTGILVMLPLMKKMYYVYEYRPLTVKERIVQFFFTAGAWLPEKYHRAIPLGVLTGAAVFFHGSAVIVLLCMLAVMGIFSKHRLEFLIIAVITYAMSTLQAGFFAPGVDLASPRLVYGFIAQDKSFTGIFMYVFMLTGVALIVTIIGLLLKFKRFIIFFLMFLTPFALTFTLSLTPDVAVNHKFLMISMALLNIFAAYAICVMMKHNTFGKFVGAMIIVLMLSTGVIDVFTIQNSNGYDDYGNRKSYAFPLTSAYQDWVLENTKTDDVFLSAWYSVNEIFLAGRMIYLGWPYYAWSGGHDTDGRGETYARLVRPVYPEDARRLMIEHEISYIIIDQGLYEKNDYDADPELLKAVFPTVFSDPERELYVLKTDYSR